MIKAEQKVLKRFNKGCVDYHLLEDGDCILIALSGGKDSLELVRLLAQRARIFKPHIEVEAAHIIMDNIPYETDRSYLQDFCAENGIKLSDEIATKIQNEMTYPGQVKITVLRETRSVAYAK